jgi:hypothetical protein
MQNIHSLSFGITIKFEANLLGCLPLKKKTMALPMNGGDHSANVIIRMVCLLASVDGHVSRSNMFSRYLKL